MSSGDGLYSLFEALVITTMVNNQNFENIYRLIIVHLQHTILVLGFD